MPSTSKSQFRFFKFLQENPEEAKKRGLTEQKVSEFTSMSKNRWKHLKEKVGKK